MYPEVNKTGINTIKEQTQTEKFTSKLLSKFSPDISEYFSRLTPYYQTKAIALISEALANRGDFLSAEEALDGVKYEASSNNSEPSISSTYVNGVITLSAIEYQKGNKQEAKKRIDKLLKESIESSDLKNTITIKFLILTDQIDELKEAITSSEQINNNFQIKGIFDLIKTVVKANKPITYYQSILALVDSVNDFSKIYLLQMVARQIGNDHSQQALRCLLKIRQIDPNNIYHRDCYSDLIWAYIGLPEWINNCIADYIKKSPNFKIELAKHFFIKKDIPSGEKTLKQVIEDTNSVLVDELYRGKILNDIGQAYILLGDSDYKKAKKYLYLAYDNIKKYNPNDHHSEDCVYDHRDALERNIDLLVEIGDIQKLEKIDQEADFPGDNSTHNYLKLAIFKIKLNTDTN